MKIIGVKMKRINWKEIDWQRIAVILSILLLLAMYRIHQDSEDMREIHRYYREYFGDVAVNRMFEELEEEYYDTIDERQEQEPFPYGYYGY